MGEVLVLCFRYTGDSVAISQSGQEATSDVIWRSASLGVGPVTDRRAMQQTAIWPKDPLDLKSLVNIRSPKEGLLAAPPSEEIAR